ncbi:hypothetical protein [Vibrio vulnificus]|uniref:hypothetical protein n=1 Tax=Vibrio vulnificus TaxID=672 RepID=UPI001CDCB3DF|nr:hypothetical protein [Vibrio vulnificus]MCA3951436.1 hypothetical protein [Vibrio vulnificus]
MHGPSAFILLRDVQNETIPSWGIASGRGSIPLLLEAEAVLAATPSRLCISPVSK